MAATSQQSGTGRMNYYKIAYGNFSTKVKEAPEGYTVISEAELKSKTQAVENIDLRNRYVQKEGDFPIQQFYSSIKGTIVSVEKDQYDKGTSLKVTITDTDDETSVLTTKFYGKTGADFMNRLLALQGKSNIDFTPYQIPTESEIDGSNIKYYNMGVSLKENGQKIKGSFNRDNGLPQSERVQNSEGQMVTSRVNMVNFLWSKVESKYGTAVPVQEAATTPSTTPAQDTAPAQAQATTAPIKTKLPF